jgi:serine/threonine protein kinase
MQRCPRCQHGNPEQSRYCNGCGLPLDISSAETEAIATGACARAVEGRFSPGTVLDGRYRIVAPLGRGGMGEVYRATDLKLDQAVALKFLPLSLSQDARTLNRLYNEVRLARQISHPNVCRIYDIADSAGLPFITMKYIDGEDLRSLLRRIGRLPLEKAFDISRRLCAGLGAAHDRGVLHRDLKPANIMIDAHGNVRITDFGLAVLGDGGEVNHLASGTPGYMSPEQLEGKPVSIQSDIYSLGLVLYELFTGRRALELKRETKTGISFVGPDLDPQIERALMHCLHPDPRARPSSAIAVSAELTGSDPLAAAIAAGETPAPELVARAGATEGLSVNTAIGCLACVIASLIIFAIVEPGVSSLRRMHVDSPDALHRAARDTLSSIGIQEPVQHRVVGFSYDMQAPPSRLRSRSSVLLAPREPLLDHSPQLGWRNHPFGPACTGARNDYH